MLFRSAQITSTKLNDHARYIAQTVHKQKTKLHRLAVLHGRADRLHGGGFAIQTEWTRETAKGFNAASNRSAPGSSCPGPELHGRSKRTAASQLHYCHRPLGDPSKANCNPTAPSSSLSKQFALAERRGQEGLWAAHQKYLAGETSVELLPTLHLKL